MVVITIVRWGYTPTYNWGAKIVFSFGIKSIIHTISYINRNVMGYHGLRSEIYYLTLGYAILASLDAMSLRGTHGIQNV